MLCLLPPFTKVGRQNRPLGPWRKGVCLPKRRSGRWGWEWACIQDPWAEARLEGLNVGAVCPLCRMHGSCGQLAAPIFAAESAVVEPVQALGDEERPCPGESQDRATWPAHLMECRILALSKMCPHCWGQWITTEHGQLCGGGGHGQWGAF
jgi:hypothetical protein